MGSSQNKLALALHVPARRINQIVLGKRRVTADTALRLARYFGTSAQFWLGLQMDYEIDVAEVVSFNNAINRYHSKSCTLPYLLCCKKRIKDVRHGLFIHSAAIVSYGKLDIFPLCHIDIFTAILVKDENHIFVLKEFQILGPQRIE